MAAQKLQDHLQPQVPHQQPKRAAKPKVVKRIRKEAKPKYDFYNVKLLGAICALCLFAYFFLQLYLDSQINHINAHTEQMRLQIATEEQINQQLASSVSELSRPERIFSIAQENGLTLNENIVRIRR